MQIVGPNCLLRPLVAADAESLARHANDRGVWQNLRDRFPHPYSLADAEAYTRTWRHVPSRRASGSSWFERGRELDPPAPRSPGNSP